MRRQDDDGKCTDQERWRAVSHRPREYGTSRNMRLARGIRIPSTARVSPPHFHHFIGNTRESCLGSHLI